MWKPNYKPRRDFRRNQVGFELNLLIPKITRKLSSGKPLICGSLVMAALANECAGSMYVFLSSHLTGIIIIFNLYYFEGGNNKFLTLVFSTTLSGT